MKLKQLIDKLQPNRVNLINLSEDYNINSISTDSRNINVSSVFFAYKGSCFDSHEEAINLYREGKVSFIVSEKDLDWDIDHIVVADSRKAVSIAYSLYYGDPLNDYKSVAITGTNGKTTTTCILSSIFDSIGSKSIRIGTTGIDLAGEIFESENTTPSPEMFFKVLSEGLNVGAELVSIEVSSHALDQGRLYGVLFDVGVFTNITGDHLDYHKNMDNYFKAKSKLFNDNTSKYKVVNIDSDYGKSLAKMIKNGLITFSSLGEADIYLVSYKSTIDSTQAIVSVFGNNIEINSPLIGRYNLENILGAIGAAYSLEIPLNNIIDGINNQVCVPGRLERISNKDIAVLVDYAHTDDALKNVLLALQDVSEGRIITVFGAGGDRDKSKRPRMAKVAESLSDIVIVTSDNPRTEDPNQIIEDILKGFKKDSNIQIMSEVDREKAIEKAIIIAKPKDIVLIAGKGHEDYQIVGKSKYPFDDRKVAMKYIEKIKNVSI